MNINKNGTKMLISLVLFNILSWILLLMISNGSWKLISLGGLAYLFGIRHAFDTDHIAAIDNVTRKLRQENQKPVSVGLFFSLGHSSVVILLSIAMIISLRSVSSHLQFLEKTGGIIGTLVSAGFLTIIGIMNLFILISLYKIFRSHMENKSNPGMDKTANALLDKRGFFNKFFNFLYKKIDSSYKIYPIGFLFGLGFDTATEVAVLGISAELAKDSSMPLWGILIFPLLFTAGMTLMDSLDGLMMMKIYDWAAIDQIRKIFFNVIITGMSVLIALLVGGIEWLQIISTQMNINTSFFNFINALDFSKIGIIVVITMACTWLGAFIYYKKILFQMNSK